MLLIAHISIALFTIAGSVALLFGAKKTVQQMTIATTTCTLITGATLVVAHNASIVHVCLGGMLLTVFACFSVAFSRDRLANQKNH